MCDTNKSTLHLSQSSRFFVQSSVFCLSVCLCGALNRTQPAVCLILIYIIYIYIIRRPALMELFLMVAFHLPLYFYLFELLFCFLLWKIIKYLSIYLPLQFLCMLVRYNKICSAIAARPRCRCVIVFAKSRRLELGDNILWTL